MTPRTETRIIEVLRKAMESISPSIDVASDHLAEFADLLDGMVDEIPVSTNEAFLLGAAAMRARRESQRRNRAMERARSYCVECGCRVDGGHLPDCQNVYYPAMFSHRNEEPGISSGREPGNRGISLVSHSTGSRTIPPMPLLVEPFGLFSPDDDEAMESE